MKRSLWIAGLIAVLPVLFTATASGHGGQYLGPGDQIPPNLGGGGDVTPPGPRGPGNGTPPGAPGRGGPTTGRGGQPGNGAGPTTGRVGTGTAGFRKRAHTAGYERWEFWWEHNKDPFLNLKARLGNRGVLSGSSSFLTGRSTRNDLVETTRPDFNTVRDTILPTLQPLMLETHPDVVDSAVLATAKMVHAKDAGICINQLIETLGHSAQTARESATLSLGVLGSKESIPVLRELMLDTVEGRRLTGQDAGVEDLVRAFAAASLGMIGEPASIADLKSVILDPNLNSKRDLKSTAILALGLMKQGHEEIVPFLMELMTDRSMDRIVRAQAPVALGKLNDPIVNPAGSSAARSVVGPITALLQSDRPDHDMRRSLAVCLGLIASVEDTEAIDALMDTVARSNDLQTRHFSVMSLAQIGFRDENVADNAEVHSRLENFLMKELVRPRRITDQPYGALGLAVYARNDKIAGLSGRAIGKLQETFLKTTNPSYRGAMAVGLGLLSARSTQSVLAAAFEESNDQGLKGYLALSLGLMRSTTHADTFRSLIQKKGLDFRFRLQLARALGLMSDLQAVPTLIAYLEKAETLSETSSAAQALGLVGDQSAVDPLVAIAKNRSKQPLTRGFACVALGIIAEKQDLPWNVAFLANSNYRAKVTATAEIFDIP